MLQGVLSPSMELLSSVDNNTGASHLWSLANQSDSHYQAAAMEAILSQATLGLISEHQGLVNYHGMLNHPSFIEGMDETQFLPQSSASANAGMSSNSASSSLGLDQKPLNDQIKHSSKPTNLMLSFSPHDLAGGGQAGMCAAKRRSWHEALSSASKADHYNLSTLDPNERGVSSPVPHTLYSVNDPKVSIASLAYPCTIVEPIHESGNPSYIENTSMGMGAYIDPAFNTRANLMQESMHAAGMCPDDDHGTCVGHATNENIRGSLHTGVLSSGSHETKEVIGTHEFIKFTHGSPFKGIKCDDNSAPWGMYKEEPFHEADGKEKDMGMALSSRQPLSLVDHASKKRPAAVAHLPSSSSAYSKRAHLQSKPIGMTCSATTTTTSSTTTKSSKSSSRNPQGPALNTNGKPRALQGSANDPQSLAARNRRERINARLKVLQELVPNGSKVDLVTMLEKAINYVKFLQLQLRVLSNDDYWQANQENGEQATKNLEKEYTAHLNAACESLIACSDNIGGHQSNYV